jgi:hypothetical protein
MPSRINKRMMLTVTPELHAVLVRWGKAAGMPAATVVSKMLEAQRPLIEGIVSGYEAAKAGKPDEAMKKVGLTTGFLMGELFK